MGGVGGGVAIWPEEKDNLIRKSLKRDCERYY